MKAIANIDGKICNPEEAKVSVFDRGFLFGDGVYETGRSAARCPLFLDEHLKRLASSASKLGIALQWSNDEIKNRLFATCKAFGLDEVYFRIIVTRGVLEKVGLDVEADKPTLVMILQEMPTNLQALRTQGYYLLTSTIIRNSALAQDPNIKTSNYLNSLLAMRDVKARGAMDGVLCDSEGNVTEGTTFSVFAVTKDGTLRTPSLEVGILDSITRRFVLEIARKENRKVEEGKFQLADFQEAAEIFIASSVREICPVNRWDDRTYPTPGKATAELQKLLSAQIAEYARTHPCY